MMKNFLFALGICLVLNNTCYAAVGNATVPGEIGRFVAQRGENGRDGSNGSTGPAGPQGPTGPTGPQGCSVSASKSNIYQDPSDITSRVVGTHVVLTDSCNAANNQEFDVNHGNDGTSFNFKGKKDTCAELRAITGAQQNDAWLVAEDGLLYIYNGTTFPSCPNGGAAFTGPAGEGVCTNVSNAATAVKNTVRSYSGPSVSHTVTVNGTSYTYYDVAGHINLTHNMCSGNSTDTTVDTQDDRCVPVVAPNGVCTGKTYYECKTQAATTGWTEAQVYYLCVATTYSSVASAIDNPCLGVAAANLSTTERSQATEYTVPTKTGSNSYYDTPGKMVTTSVKCDPGSGGSNNTIIGAIQDDCKEIPKPNGVCAENGKVYYKCTQQNDGTEYNLCAEGSSVLGAAQIVAQSAAETAVAAVDPCASVANGTNDEKKAQIKSMNSTYTLQTVSNGNDRTAVGYSTLTKTTCATGADATQVEYQYDTCKEIADTRTSGACSGNDKVYLECVNQTKGASDSGYTYKVCQTVTANTSLSGKIMAAQTAATNAANAVNGKLDASALTIDSDGTLKYDDSCSTNIAGVTNVKMNGGAWYRKYAVYTTCPNDVTTNSKLRMWLNNFCSQNSDGNGTAYTWTNLPGANCYSDSITGSEAPYKFNLYVKIDSNDMVHPDSIGRVVGEQLDDMGIVDSATGKMSVNMLPASAVTTDNLATNLASSTDAVFNLGTDANPVEMTLSDVVELLHVITGNCTESTGTLNRTVECDNGAIGSRVQMTRQLETSTVP